MSLYNNNKQDQRKKALSRTGLEAVLLGSKDRPSELALLIGSQRQMHINSSFGLSWNSRKEDKNKAS